MSLLMSICAVLFPHEMSLMGSGTYFGRFLRVFLPIYAFLLKNYSIKVTIKDSLILTFACDDTLMS